MNLTAYRSLISGTWLRDSSNVVWSTTQVDDAVREALRQYSRAVPRRLVGTVTLGADGREMSLSSLTSLLEPLEVWCPYVAADRDHPPLRRAFSVLTRPTISIYIEDGDEPQSGDIVRVVYQALHTIDSLDGASATTVVSWDEYALAEGAAALCVEARARQLGEEENVAGAVRFASRRWSLEAMKRFGEWLRSITQTESGFVGWSLGEFEAGDRSY